MNNNDASRFSVLEAAIDARTIAQERWDMTLDAAYSEAEEGRRWDALMAAEDAVNGAWQWADLTEQKRAK